MATIQHSSICLNNQVFGTEDLWVKMPMKSKSFDLLIKSKDQAGEKARGRPMVSPSPLSLSLDSINRFPPLNASSVLSNAA